jgi:hypothetical protein
LRMTAARVLTLAVLVLSCGGNSALPHNCVPGQSIACVGVAGCQGGQVCNAAGTAYGPDLLESDTAPLLPPVAPDAAPDLPGPDLPPPVPASCQSMGVASLVDFEEKFVIPRCGGPNSCHQAVFPPRNLHMSAMLRTNLVGKKASTLCKNDFYIDVDRPEQSYLLATITPLGDKVTCPSGGEGGSRMPNKDIAVAGPRLSEEEIDCFRWWVFELAAIARRR